MTHPDSNRHPTVPKAVVPAIRLPDRYCSEARPCCWSIEWWVMLTTIDLFRNDIVFTPRWSVTLAECHGKLLMIMECCHLPSHKYRMLIEVNTMWRRFFILIHQKAVDYFPCFSRKWLSEKVNLPRYPWQPSISRLLEGIGSRQNIKKIMTIWIFPIYLCEKMAAIKESEMLYKTCFKDLMRTS